MELLRYKLFFLKKMMMYEKKHRLTRRSKANNKGKAIPFIGVICLIASLIMLRQLLTAGYFSCLTEDTWTYTSWASQFIDALNEGIIYPRWTPLNFWDYGSPTFILYPPLAFYLTALLNVLTGSIIAAMNITKYAALLLSGIGMFFLVKEFYQEKTALLSALFYMAFPFNVFGLYYYGTFASVVSLIWFSPIMLFINKYFKSRQYKYVLYAGVSYGGLILTHLINAYMFSFVMAGFVGYLSVMEKRPRDIVVFLFIILIGCMVSAAYLFPLIFEKQFFNINAFVAAEGGFDFSKFFIYPNRTGQMPSGNFWPVYYKEFETSVFLLIIFICIFTLRITQIRSFTSMRTAHNVNLFFLGTALGSLLLLFGMSSFLWNSIPFLKFIQFPFRWLNITVFAVAFLSATGFRMVESVYKKGAEGYAIIAVVFLMFLICFLYDYKYIVTSPVYTPDELIPPKAVNWTKEHLPRGVDINKIRETENSGKLIFITGEGKAEVVAWNTASRTIKTDVKKHSIIRIRTFYFPGWKAYIDGTETEIKKENDSGAMLVPIPGGVHTLELKFRDTPVRHYSGLVTICSLLLIVILYVILSVRVHTIAR